MTGRGTLPPWAVKLIHNGVPKARLDRKGDWAVHDAANKLCLSAMQHGYTFAHLAGEMFRPGERLAIQLSCKDGKPQSLDDGRKRLLRIWKDAEKWLDEQPEWSNADEAKRRAEALFALVEDADADLLDEERAVLAYAAESARERGLCRVALPQRAVAAATGLSRRQARQTLERLDERRLLPLHTHGLGCIGCPANLYTLPSVEMSGAGHKTTAPEQDQDERAIRLAEATERAIRRSPDRGRAVDDGTINLTLTIHRGETLTDVLRRVLDDDLRRLPTDREPSEDSTSETLPDNVSRLHDRDSR
jgi:hypothetical protein